MKLNDIDLKELLPLHFREDITSQGYIFALNNQLRKIASLISKVNIYGDIDNLDHNILDELAWQFNCFEYKSSFSLNVKRSLIKNCILTHQKRGTVLAVEKAINDIFGTGWVEEWFDYPNKGQPYHFNVHTSNQNVSGAELDEFYRVLNSVKNVRSILDKVIIELNINTDLSHGCLLKEIEIIYI